MVFWSVLSYPGGSIHVALRIVAWLVPYHFECAVQPAIEAEELSKFVVHCYSN